MRDAETERINQTETRNFFQLQAELRSLSRSAHPDAARLKIQPLCELQHILDFTLQPHIAAGCRKLLAEFEYVRRDLVEIKRQGARSQ